MRQLWDVKGQGDLLAMDLGNLPHYGALCARALARAHARTGDAVPIAGYLGTATGSTGRSPTSPPAYAANNDRDHAALVDAIAAGRVSARSPS